MVPRCNQHFNIRHDATDCDFDNTCNDTQEHWSIIINQRFHPHTRVLILDQPRTQDGGIARPRLGRYHPNLGTSTMTTNHDYELVAHEEGQLYASDDSLKVRRRISLLWRLQTLVKTYPRRILILALTISLVLSALISLQSRKPSTHIDCDGIDDGYQCQPEISHHWGQYSPYFSVPSDIPNQTPDQCEINFVQVLSRHGARDPTHSKTILYFNLIKSLRASVESFKGQYAFLKDYQYALGADQLTRFGERQMVNSGIKFFNRYEDLAQSFTPFVRASGQQRVIDSAQMFTKGYHEACSNQTRKSDAECNKWPYPYVEISEETGSHNPLDHGLCDAFEDDHDAGLTKTGQDTFRDIFATPITQRLNRDLPGAELQNDETIMIMDLCPFETVAHPDGKISSFCHLFTKDEWKQYDYYQTLGKWYGFASYDHLGPTQGVGFTNELIARLTRKPVEDHTSVDHGLDDNPKTFPLGEKWKIYADFSHDK